MVYLTQHCRLTPNIPSYSTRVQAAVVMTRPAYGDGRRSDSDETGSQKEEAKDIVLSEELLETITDNSTRLTESPSILADPLGSRHSRFTLDDRSQMPNPWDPAILLRSSWTREITERAKVGLNEVSIGYHVDDVDATEDEEVEGRWCEIEDTRDGFRENSHGVTVIGR